MKHTSRRLRHGSSKEKLPSMNERGFLNMSVNGRRSHLSAGLLLVMFIRQTGRQKRERERERERRVISNAHSSANKPRRPRFSSWETNGSCLLVENCIGLKGGKFRLGLQEGLLDANQQIRSHQTGGYGGWNRWKKCTSTSIPIQSVFCSISSTLEGPGCHRRIYSSTTVRVNEFSKLVQRWIAIFEQGELKLRHRNYSVPPIILFMCTVLRCHVLF